MHGKITPVLDVVPVSKRSSCITSLFPQHYVKWQNLISDRHNDHELSEDRCFTNNHFPKTKVMHLYILVKSLY